MNSTGLAVKKMVKFSLQGRYARFLAVVHAAGVEPADSFVVEGGGEFALIISRPALGKGTSRGIVSPTIWCSEGWVDTKFSVSARLP